MMQPAQLPGYERSAKEAIAFAQSRPIAEKIERAIGALRLYEAGALALNPAGYWLAYSGGKDSDVILELAKMAGVHYRPAYNVTTIDPPELVYYIREHHPEVEFLQPKVALLTRLQDAACGPPTRLSRWCCEEYKERGGVGWGKIIGVRAAESPRRALAWAEFKAHRTSGFFVCPIIFWTDADVWQFHRERGIPHCRLYDEGFKRLGCIGCPLAGPKQQAAGFARWPRYEAAWKRAVFAHYARWHGVPTRTGTLRWFEDMGSAQGLWDWWRSGKAAAKKGEGCQMEWMFQ